MYQNNDPDHTYVDISVVNLATGNVDKKPLNYQETRQMPYLSNTANDYYCSITRFSIETGSQIPIWIPSVFDSPTLLTYTLYFYYTTSNGNTLAESQRVFFRPENRTISSTDPAYFYVYSMAHIVSLFNETLDYIFQRMTSGIIQNGSTPTFTKPAFFSLDSDKFVLNSPYDTFNYPYQPSGVIPIGKGKLGMSPDLYYLLSSFSANRLNGEVYAFNIQNLNNSNILSVPTVIGQPATDYFIQTIQEYSSSSAFNPCKSLVFCSNLVPISASLLATPKFLNENVVGFSNSGNNSSQISMLTDFESDIVDFSANQGILQYSANPYRLIDLQGISNSFFNSIDIQVYWKDIHGNLNTIYLEPGASFSCKILFVKKNVYKNNN